jgi:hypothetical protein
MPGKQFGPKPDPGNKAWVRLGSEGFWVRDYRGGRPPFWRTPRKGLDLLTRKGLGPVTFKINTTNAQGTPRHNCPNQGQGA